MDNLEKIAFNMASGHNIGANMTPEEKQLIDKAQAMAKENLDLKEQVYDLEAAVEGQVGVNEGLAAENVALKKQNAPIKGYLSELADYGETVLRLRNEIKHLKIDLGVTTELRERGM